MSLQHEMAAHGRLLFRWRSYAPFLILPLALAALPDAARIDVELGDGIDDLWESFCIGVSVIGFLIRCDTIGHAAPDSSGRNTKRQRAEALNITGLYSVVRHPLYLANFLVFLGMAMYLTVWWLALIGILSYWLYYERIIMAEESFLASTFGDEFEQWAARTPAFIPSPRLWKRPELPFSIKRTLRSEYATVLLLCVMFVLLEAVEMVWVERTHESYWPLPTTIGLGLAVFLIVRTLKKRTRLLRIEPAPMDSSVSPVRESEPQNT
ncbi:MAG TPA: isoprenylcysteine carboxylmethyltransferase family protein [Tepidisphaeraceae bacterium]|jgi:protein-S-isoprenylcysteine O-methyltransferase Ste14|nr:isoprenylcysteine carboxylmethyltransferase family protein [Tepidisphaeraceae bacterium]